MASSFVYFYLYVGEANHYSVQRFMCGEAVADNYENASYLVSLTCSSATVSFFGVCPVLLDSSCSKAIGSYQ